MNTYAYIHHMCFYMPTHVYRDIYYIKPYTFILCAYIKHIYITNICMPIYLYLTKILCIFIIYMNIYI